MVNKNFLEDLIDEITVQQTKSKTFAKQTAPLMETRKEVVKS